MENYKLTKAIRFKLIPKSDNILTPEFSDKFNLIAFVSELNNFLDNPGRQAKQVDYFANRMTKMPSVIVEIGFISNPGEEKLMLDPVYQNKISWSIYAGIARYLADARPAMALAAQGPE